MLRFMSLCLSPALMPIAAVALMQQGVPQTSGVQPYSSSSLSSRLGQIRLRPDSLDFGYTIIEEPKYRYFSIITDGPDSLIKITSVTTTNPAFSTDMDSATLGSGEELSVKGTFHPSEPDFYTDSLMIVTSDTTQQPSVVWLGGRVHPIINTSPQMHDLGVGKDANIRVDFSRQFQIPETAIHDIAVHGSLSGRYLGEFAVDRAASRLSFFPLRPFVSGETVSVSLSSSLFRSLDYDYAQGYGWSFNTAVLQSASTFEVAERHEAQHQIQDLAITDIDGDGDLDIVLFLSLFV